MPSLYIGKVVGVQSGWFILGFLSVDFGFLRLGATVLLCLVAKAADKTATTP
jgi:hypothetical protein